MNLDAKTVEIKRLAKEDLTTFKSLIDLLNVVFEESESNVGMEADLLKLLNSNNFVALVAISRNEVLGGLTAYELPLVYSTRSEILLYDMAVKSDHQRMGIGRRLIQSLKEYCAENGIKEFFVLAHEEDKSAIEFYHSTEGKGEKVVNFVYAAAKK